MKMNWMGSWMMISTRSRFRISPAGAGVRGWVACPGPGGGALERHGDHWPPVRLPGRFPRQKGRGQGVGASLSTKTHTAAQGGSAAGAPDRPGPWSLRKGLGAQLPPWRLNTVRRTRTVGQAGMVCGTQRQRSPERRRDSASRWRGRAGEGAVLRPAAVSQARRIFDGFFGWDTSGTQI